VRSYSPWLPGQVGDGFLLRARPTGALHLAVFARPSGANPIHLLLFVSRLHMAGDLAGILACFEVDEIGEFSLSARDRSGMSRERLAATIHSLDPRLVWKQPGGGE
jgi:hypothetical protein